MKLDSKQLLLYAVTDRSWTKNQSLYEQVEASLKGGVTCVQLREKEMNNEEFIKEALEIKDLCNKYHVPFIINDNLDVAIATKAFGIHVGQSDICVNNIRELVGNDMIIGVSAQTKEQAILAEQQKADYIGVGSIFTTTTKLDADSVSLETLKEICAATSIPVVAIGGINKSNIPLLVDTKIDGVALVSAIFASNDIEKETNELLQLIKNIVK